MKKQYEQEKEQMEQKIQELQNTHSQLQQSYNNEKLTLQQEVQTFQGKIMNIEKQYQDEIQKIKFDNDQEIESYKIQITQLKQENEKSHYEFSAQIDKLQNDYNFLNQEKQNMKKQFEDSLQSKYLLYQTEIKSIQASNQEVIEKMKMQFELQIQQSQNDQQQIINKKEEEIQQLKQKQEQEIRRLIIMIEKKDKQIEEITIKANKLTKQNFDFSTSLSQYLMEQLILKIENQEMSNQIQKLKIEKHGALQKLSSSAKQQLKQRDLIIEKQQKELTDMKLENDNLQKSLIKSQLQIDTINKQYQHSQIQSQQNIDQLTQEKLNFINQLSQEKDELIQKLKEKDSQYTEIYQKFEQLIFDNDKIINDDKSQIKHLIEKIEQLEFQKYQIEQNNESNKLLMEYEIKMRKDEVLKIMDENFKLKEEQNELLNKLPTKEYEISKLTQQIDNLTHQIEHKQQSLFKSVNQITILQQKVDDFSQSTSSYLLDSIKYQIEKDFLKDALVKYDNQLKQKRQQISEFEFNYKQLYDTDNQLENVNETIDEQVSEVIDQMIIILEIQDLSLSPTYLINDQNQQQTMNTMLFSPSKQNIPDCTINFLDQCIYNSPLKVSTKNKLSIQHNLPPSKAITPQANFRKQIDFGQKSVMKEDNSHLYQLSNYIEQKLKEIEPIKPLQQLCIDNSGKKKQKLSVLKQIIEEQKQYEKRTVKYQRFLINFSQMLLFTGAWLQYNNQQKEKQLKKTKRRLVKVLQAYEQYKQSTIKKEKFTSKLDLAARKIQRFWRKSRQQVLERDRNKVTHRYIKEKLQAQEMLWQLEVNQQQTGKFLIQESFNQSKSIMGIFLKEFLKNKNTSSIALPSGYQGVYKTAKSFAAFKNMKMNKGGKFCYIDNLFFVDTLSGELYIHQSRKFIVQSGIICFDGENNIVFIVYY